MSMFQKATRRAVKVRIGLVGPSGSGKTMTALRIAMGLVPGGRIAVIDTEGESARLYVGETVPEGVIAFDVLELDDYHPDRFVEAIKAADAEGFDVVIIDSLSHAWEGVLDEKDRVAAQSRSKDTFGAWRTVTPMHNNLVQTILRSSCHVIATMRAKTEYLVERDGGRNKISKVGLAPVQRAGMEYEFTIVGDIELDTHNLVVSKTRCNELDGKVIPKAGGELGRTIARWLAGGASADEELDDALDAVGLTREDFDRWSRLKGRPPTSEFTAGQAYAAADFIRKNPLRVPADLAKADVEDGGEAA